MSSTKANPKVAYYNDAFLTEMRACGDPAADALIEDIFSSGEGVRMREIMQCLSGNADLDNADLPPQLKAFYEEHATLPDWADERQMRRGAAFFARYGGPIMSMLGSLSLPYCYAGADGAQVLYMSQRIYNDTQRRLLETGQFVLDVMARDAFTSGKGFASVLNVRLMHAAVRHHILASKQWNFDWGHPINQEDMAGTIGAFSYICVRGLRKVGFSLDLAEVEAFQHLWNVIGVIMGVREELLPNTGTEAFQLDRAISRRQFRPSEAGRTLTQALLKTMGEQPLDGLPENFVAIYSRFLLGKEIADLLEVPDIPPPPGLLELLQLRNYTFSLTGLGDDGQLRQIKRQLDAGQSEAMVRFAVPLAL